ncbi:MAG: mannan-binding protein [Gammaproteobacteria bacterium]
MRRKNVVCSLMIVFILSLSHMIYAGYYPSAIPITDNKDAWETCPVVCEKNMTRWTGHWWITDDPQYLCECFHDWPYCPIVANPPPPYTCTWSAVGP